MGNRYKKKRVEGKLTAETCRALRQYSLYKFNGNSGLGVERAVEEMIKRERRAGGVLNNQVVTSAQLSSVWAENPEAIDRSLLRCAFAEEIRLELEKFYKTDGGDYELPNTIEGDLLKMMILFLHGQTDRKCGRNDDS